MEKKFRSYQAQDSIAQVFQPLVMSTGSWMLGHVRRVSECNAQYFRLDEYDPDCLLQFSKHCLLFLVFKCTRQSYAPNSLAVSR
jgi:hypothetical protein